MKLIGGLGLVVSALAVALSLSASASADDAQTGGWEEPRARVITDGRLRPGHVETIRVTGFPGKGVVHVSFFPTAICEDGCGARSIRGGKTNAGGAARFRVRVPHTFFDIRERHVFFRDREWINVNAVWEGPERSFAVAYADPEPIIVRSNGKRDD